MGRCYLAEYVQFAEDLFHDLLMGLADRERDHQNFVRVVKENPVFPPTSSPLWVAQRQALLQADEDQRAVLAPLLSAVFNAY